MFALCKWVGVNITRKIPLSVSFISGGVHGTRSECGGSVKKDPDLKIKE